MYAVRDITDESFAVYRLQGSLEDNLALND